MKKFLLAARASRARRGRRPPPTWRASATCRPRRRSMSRRHTTGPASMSVSTAAAAGAVRTSRDGSPGAFDTSGGLVGGTLGYNWQMGQVVFGLEGDLDWSNINGSTTCGGLTLRDPQRLARHRARPSRLRVRPLHALRHRRRRLRRRQDLGRRHRHAQRHQGRLDRRRRPRVRASPDRGPPRSNISTSISADARLAARLRRELPHQHRARRSELPVLIDGATTQQQSPGVRSGAFSLSADALRRRPWSRRRPARARRSGRARRRSRGCSVRQVAGEAKIAIAEQAGERDLADVGHRRRATAARPRAPQGRA